MRHVIAAALVAVLVVSAGCGGLAGDGTAEGTTTGGSTTERTATPSSLPTLSTPTTPTREPIEASEFPAVEGTEVNETMLARTHDRGLANVSYTLSLEQQADRTNVTVTTRRRGNESLLVTTVNGTSETDYTNGSTEYIRTEQGNGSVVYRNQSVPDGEGRYTAHAVMDDYIESADHTPVAVTTYDGVPVVELTAGRSDVKPGGALPNTTFDTFESRLLVDREGRIRLFTYRISGTLDGERFLFTLRFRLSNVGSTTVERPAWVSRA